MMTEAYPVCNRCGQQEIYGVRHVPRMVVAEPRPDFLNRFLNEDDDTRNLVVQIKVDGCIIVDNRVPCFCAELSGSCPRHDVKESQS